MLVKMIIELILSLKFEREHIILKENNHNAELHKNCHKIENNKNDQKTKYYYIKQAQRRAVVDRFGVPKI